MADDETMEGCDPISEGLTDDEATSPAGSEREAEERLLEDEQGAP